MDNSRPKVQSLLLKNHCRPLTLRGDDSNAIKANGDWNDVHAELTQRTLVDRDFFEITGDGQIQNGIGICIDSPEIAADPQIRGHQDCVGFYADSGMFYKTDSDGKEHTIKIQNPIPSSTHGIIYYKEFNAVSHKFGDRWDEEFYVLPEHFRNQTVRAIA